MHVRDRLIALRKQIPKPNKYLNSRAIATTLMATRAWQTAKTICLYVSLPDEVDTSILMRSALGERKVICVPRMKQDRTLGLYRIRTFDDLAPGKFGIHEPKAYCEEMPTADVDLFIVPGVAFDTRGNRMGWGAGYYDKLLAGSIVPKIGLAYHCQIVPRLTHKKYDIPMDTVITESSVLSSPT